MKNSMLKNIAMICALAAVVGVCCGALFHFVLGDGELPSVAVFQDEGGDGEGSAASSQRQIFSGKNRTPDVVTNKSKVCSVPGCGRAVFVTYRGRELCVQCYGEEKKADTEASQAG